MKTLVKTISVIILLILSTIDIVCLVYSVKGVVNSNNAINYYAPLINSEHFDFIPSIFDLLIMHFFRICFIVLVLLFLIEIFLKTAFFFSAVTDTTYDMYLVFSITSLVEVIVNTVLVFIASGLYINIDGVYDAEKAVIGDGLFYGFLIYVFTGVWIILDIIYSNRCVKEEKRRGLTS